MSAVVTFDQPATSLASRAVTGSGFAMPMDSGDVAEPAGAGPRELVLAGLGGCTGMDVASILAKKRQVPETYRVEVVAETAADPPRVFTRVVVEHQVSGAVAPEPLRRAVELSATRYCPVSAMLSRSVRIEHRYRLQQTGEPERSALVVVTGPEGESA